MRIGLLLLLSTAVLGGLVGTLMLRDPGYVLVTYAGRIMETSLWFAILLLAVFYAILRLLVFVVVRTLRGGHFFAAWRTRRSRELAAHQTQRGLLLLAEGEWAEAKRLLVGAARRVALPFANYLNAAQAAHELGNAEERDELLLLAEESAPGGEVAAPIARARMLMAEQRWDEGRRALLQLRESQARHPQILTLLMRCCEALEDWQALIELLPRLRKAKVADDETLDALERRAWSGCLGAADYAEVWQRLPRDLKREPELVAAHANRLVAAGEVAAAEQAVRKALNRNWHDSLAALYGRIASPYLSRQLEAAENWLKDYPDNAILLLALGRIAMMDGAWSKSREYLEESLRLEPSTETQGELGRLLTHLGEFIRGSEYLGMSRTDLPNLPLPPRPGR